MTVLSRSKKAAAFLYRSGRFAVTAGAFYGRFERLNRAASSPGG